MPKVLCRLPNASELIDGVRFVSHKSGMVSEEINDEQAKRFCSIDGYELSDAGEPDERDELRAKAAALNIQFDSRWGAKRLADEIKKAEDAAAEEAAKAAGNGGENTGDGKK